MKTVKLSEICDIKAGGTPSRAKKEYWSNATISWCKIKDFTGKYLDKTEEKITSIGLENSSAKLFKKGTILFSIFATIGEVTILKINATTNQAIAGIEIISEEVDVDYLYYYLKNMKSNVLKLSRGVAQNNINLGILKNLEIKLYKVEKQRKIANQLDKVQELIDLNQEQINLLDEFIKSKFIEMFGTITFPKFVKRKLKDISVVKTGNTPSRKIKEYYGDYIEWIKSDNINNDNTYLTKAVEYLSEKGKEKGRVAPINSILVTCIAGSISCIGNAGINNREVCFNQQINAIIPKDGLNYLFMYYQIINNKEYIQSFVNKSMKGMLSKGKMEEIEFIFPSLEMQNKFVKIAEVAENQKQKYQTNLEETQELMDTLMNKYFN